MKSHAPTSAELLNCPFCGGSVTLEKATESYSREHGKREWWGVVCRNTINLGGTCAIEQRPSASEEAATERWNRRAAMQTAEPVGEVCGIREYDGQAIVALYDNDDLAVGNLIYAAPDRAPSIAPATVLAGVDLAVIARSYDWTIDQHGEVLGVTSGDMGYENTGIKFTGDTLAIWNDGVLRITGPEPEPAPSIDSAADAKWQRLLTAARTYAHNYCQDEADLEEVLPMIGDGTCKEEARELFAAIAALQPEGGAKP